MGNNLDEYDNTRGLKGIEVYKALVRIAKKISSRGPDGKTAEEYTLAVHEFDPDDEITKMCVNEIRKLSESEHCAPKTKRKRGKLREYHHYRAVCLNHTNFD